MDGYRHPAQGGPDRMVLRSHWIGHEPHGGQRGAAHLVPLRVKEHSAEWIALDAKRKTSSPPPHGSHRRSNNLKVLTEEDGRWCKVTVGDNPRLRFFPRRSVVCLSTPSVHPAAGSASAWLWRCPRSPGCLGPDALFLSHTHPVELMDKQASSPRGSRAAAWNPAAQQSPPARGASQLVQALMEDGWRFSNSRGASCRCWRHDNGVWLTKRCRTQ